MRDKSNFDSLHRFSFKNKELLAKSESAGCFYCRSIFPALEIKKWVDGEPRSEKPEGGLTALCARCGTDAVLPSAAPIELTEDLLAEMNEHWF